jgi:hypothetical protein
MGAAALSRREFCEFIDVSNRELATGYGHGPFRSRASSPISHAGGGSSACVSLNVSRELPKLTVRVSQQDSRSRV